MPSFRCSNSSRGRWTADEPDRLVGVRILEEKRCQQNIKDVISIRLTVTGVLRGSSVELNFEKCQRKMVEIDRYTLFRWPGASNRVCGFHGVQVYSGKILVWRIILVRSLLCVKSCFRWFMSISWNQRWQPRPNQKDLCLDITLTNTDGHKNILSHGKGFMCSREIIAFWRWKWVMLEVMTSADTVIILRTGWMFWPRALGIEWQRWVVEVDRSVGIDDPWNMWKWALFFMESKDLSKKKKKFSPVKNYMI